MTRIVLDNCFVSDCDIAMSVPQGTPLRVSGTTFLRTDKVLEVRDAPPGFHNATNALILGLPEGTTWEELREALRQIRAAPQQQREQRAEKTSIASRLADVGSWTLETASKLVTLAEYCERQGWL